MHYTLKINTEIGRGPLWKLSQGHSFRSPCGAPSLRQRGERQEELGPPDFIPAGQRPSGEHSLRF